jgi:hypothetical protein
LDFGGFMGVMGGNKQTVHGGEGGLEWAGASSLE